VMEWGKKKQSSSSLLVWRKKNAQRDESTFSESAGFPIPKKLSLEFGTGHPLDLSISVSGGKENNRDSLSSGERTEQISTTNLSGTKRSTANTGRPSNRYRTVGYAPGGK